ncbi:hypothetical protein [Nonomuraea sp. NPDC050643]|uniref:hypothetical protein n=1 Tax=Nonomuraea sp. NPDC050643 TaxID=3155660 RepID=UPI0034044089
MAREPISLDDLLTRQDRAGTLSTVEAVPDRPDRVKVTPFVSGLGCSCSLGVTVPKDALESITTTEDTKECCGKRLMVVEVSFADPALSEVFRQLGHAVGKAARQPDVRGGTCAFEHKHCVQNCRRAYPLGGSAYLRCLDVCQEELNACTG